MEYFLLIGLLLLAAYMSDNAVTSGDGCDPYSDDEDCFDDDNGSKSKNGGNGHDDEEDGSGSGDGSDDSNGDDDDSDRDRKRRPGAGNKSNGKSNNNANNKSSSNGKSGDDPDDEEIENWPPWVTAKPAGDKDIVVEEGQDDPKLRVKSSSSSPSHFTTAVIYYLVPMSTCLIGSILSW